MLEGGQDKEDQKRDEIFYNETLSPDEIDRLFEPKGLTNFKKYDSKGEHKVTDFNADGNLIIKGNNLLALHCLKQKYRGEIKLIYIDPPYNRLGDEFKYNDKFSHSTWLTFMKNRLEIAKQMLSEDGSIFIQIDDIEFAYIKTLCDEIFDRNKFAFVIAVKRGSVTGHKTINEGVVNVKEYILCYAKNKNEWIPNKVYKARGRNDRYNKFILNVKNHYSKWRIISLLDAFSKYKHIKKSQLNKTLGNQYEDELYTFVKNNSKAVVQFAYPDEDKVSKEAKALIKKSESKPDNIFYLKREDTPDIYLLNGNRLLFYSDRLMEIDGELVTAELISDFWDDLLPNDLHNEGGVKLKKGKKPEKLLKRILEIGINSKSDIVLDFFVGSGTTCAVAHKMGIKYIGIEQLDYGENDSVVRLLNVINGKDKSGITKAVKWKGGGSFVYVELMEWNEQYMREIENVDTTPKLLNIYKKIKKEAFFRYDVDISNFEEKEFNKLQLKEQKQVLCECLDKNHLYVNLSEMDDATYKVSAEDKRLNKEFYKTVI